MKDSQLYVVLGAGGGIGGAVTRLLASQGRSVRAVGRRRPPQVPAGAAWHAADLSDPTAALGACAGAAVVIHCAQPAYGRWAEDFPSMNAAVVAAAAATGARLVFADNLYMYGPITGPISEETLERASSRKGAVRRALAGDLLRAHEEGHVRVAIGRASDYFGPGGVGSLAGAPLFGDALSGKPVRWPGDPDLPHALSYLPDVARGLVTLADAPQADGRAWLLPTAPAVSPREFIGIVAAAAGRSVAVKPTGKLAMRLAGLFIPEARELPDIWAQFTTPWEVDASRFQAAFGPLAATPLEQAVAETVAWWRGHLAQARG